MNTKRLSAVWQQAWNTRGFALQFVLTLLAGAVGAISMAAFLAFVESRPGVQIPDPVLQLFDPVNCTWLTFGIIYLATLAAVISLIRHPFRLLIGMQTYVLLLLVRMLMMYVVPLEAPHTMIPLPDPFIELIVGSEAVLTKDLFFSGHTSTCFMFFLVAVHPGVRAFFLAATLMVAACVLLQHVHYTVDVLVAPFVCYACYRAAQWIAPRSGRQQSLSCRNAGPVR